MTIRSLAAFRTAVLATLVPLAAACGGGASTGATTAASRTVALSHLTLVRDDASAKEAVIGLDGGRISATAADGAVFVLTVPPGALAGDVRIRAIPAKLEGVSFPTSTVVFEPSGLVFYDDARLTITPRNPVPVAQQFLYGISDDGSAVTAAMVDVTQSTPTLLIQHFSGDGLAQATQADRTTMLAHQPSDATARSGSDYGASLQVARQAELLGTPGGEAILKALDAYGTEIVGPTRQAAGGTCDHVAAAARVVMGYERQRQLLGLGSAEGQIQALGAVSAAMAPGGVCEQEAIAKCKAAKDPSILIAFWLSSPSAPATGSVAKRAKKICNPSTDYTATGAGKGIVITGTVSDLTQPFSLHGSVQAGGSVTFRYTPTSATGGTYTYKGAGLGLSLTGHGTYVLSGASGGPRTLTQDGVGCVAKRFCATGTEVVVLAPVDG